jgi:DNA-binding response OmpR family regulator
MTKKKILVVDDSQTALFLERMILQKGPYDLLTARDGEEAVLRALADRPDLIVMDVVMPRKTGVEACRELKGRAETRAIPIILATTRGDPESVEAGWAAGCNDYVTKPVNGPELLAKVRGLIGE